MYDDIKMVIFDIDGVLTDGMVYVDEAGRESKAYRLTEIDALNEMIRAGYSIAAITGEDASIVDIFERRVKWTEFIRGCKDKRAAIRRICDMYELRAENVCYIGDGKYDIPAIEYAGLGICPRNAIPKVKDVADVILNNGGGEGCVNELLELFIK